MRGLVGGARGGGLRGVAGYSCTLPMVRGNLEYAHFLRASRKLGAHTQTYICRRVFGRESFDNWFFFHPAVRAIVCVCVRVRES